jgi:hypothetical protein
MWPSPPPSPWRPAAGSSLTTSGSGCRRAGLRRPVSPSGSQRDRPFGAGPFCPPPQCVTKRSQFQFPGLRRRLGMLNRAELFDINPPFSKEVSHAYSNPSRRSGSDPGPVRLLARPGGIHACPHAHAVPHPSREPATAPTPGELTWTDQVFQKTWTTEDGVQLMTARYVLPAAEHPENVPAWAIITEYFKGQGEAYLAQAEGHCRLCRGRLRHRQASNYDFSPTPRRPPTPSPIRTTAWSALSAPTIPTSARPTPPSSSFRAVQSVRRGPGSHLFRLLLRPGGGPRRVLKAIHAVTDPLEGYRSADVDRLFHEDNFYLTTRALCSITSRRPSPLTAAGIPNLPFLYRPVDLTVADRP